MMQKLSDTVSVENSSDSAIGGESGGESESESDPICSSSSL